MIILISGPAGAGKSTVSRLLSKTFGKCALIEVDLIRQMIKQGNISPFAENGVGDGQLRLGVMNACSLAKNFAQAGFHVIVDDVVSETKRLDLYFEQLSGLDLRVFLLLPNEETMRKRDLQRAEGSQMKESATVLHKRFQKLLDSEKRWTVIDSSDHTAEETVQAISDLL